MDNPDNTKTGLDKGLVDLSVRGGNRPPGLIAGQSPAIGTPAAPLSADDNHLQSPPESEGEGE